MQFTITQDLVLLGIIIAIWTLGMVLGKKIDEHKEKEKTTQGELISVLFMLPLISVIIMLAWNIVIPVIGGPELNFWQAMCLRILCVMVLPGMSKRT